MDVRIGYPNEKLGNDSTGEINDPMYSTSVGLLLHGHDILQHTVSGALNKPMEESHVFVSATGKEKNEPAVNNEGETPEDTDESQEEQKKKTTNLFANFKKTIEGFFDVNDSANVNQSAYTKINNMDELMNFELPVNRSSIIKVMA